MTVGNGLVCVESNGSARQHAAALSVKWQMNTTAFVYSSPTVSPDGSAVYFGPSGDATVHAVDAGTGASLWTHAPNGGSTKSAEGALSPDGKVYFVVGQDRSNCGTVLAALSTTDGSAIWDPNARPWRGATGSCSSPSALTVDGAGIVWVSTGRGALFGFEPTSGNITYNCTGAALGTSGYSGGLAIARDGLMILMGDSGGITAIGA